MLDDVGRVPEEMRAKAVVVYFRRGNMLVVDMRLEHVGEREISH
jgi:hypothetical protein